MEGPIALTPCVDEGRHDCALEGSCRVQPHWGAVNAALRGALGDVSLASLARAPATSSSPFVSSEVETRSDIVPKARLSISLETNGVAK